MLFIKFWIFQIIINGFTIRSCNRCHIEGRFHSAFDLKAVNPRIKQIRDMFDHAKILGIKNIGASFIFINRKILTRSFLFHNCIFPATRMRTGSLVGISACKITAEQTSSGIRNAHSSMHKGLNLQILRNVCTDLFDFLHGKLPCRNHSLRSQCMPEMIGGIVCVIRLGTDMAFDFRTDTFCDLKHPRIGNDQCVRFHFF